MVANFEFQNFEFSGMKRGGLGLLYRNFLFNEGYNMFVEALFTFIYMMLISNIASFAKQFSRAWSESRNDV